jgi:hypothetical protein
MTVNRFDQASRYGAKLDAAGFLRWLLQDSSLTFDGWLDTRSLPFPGEKDRTCDTVARLIDAAEPESPWAVPVEFQTQPDGAMFGRLLEYLGRLWRERRPDGRARRYQVGAALVNLTGRRRTASRRMRLGQTRVLTRLSVVERNLARESAAATLAGIAGGTVACCIPPWIPLKRGGGGAAIITQWVQLAQAEPDSRLRADYGGLALVFAELTPSRQQWQQALQGWNVVESQQVLEWMAQGEAKGALRIRRDDVRAVLEDRFGPLPASVIQQIEAVEDLVRLRATLLQAYRIQNLTDLQL